MDQRAGADDASPPLRPRRPRGRSWYAGRVLEAVPRVLFYLVMGVLIVLTALLGVGGIVSAAEPVIWGTFTEERCEPARYGCRSFGTWVSDDGAIRRHDVALDGAPGSDGTVRASYRPTGFNNDDQNNVVHVELWASGFVWFPWALLVVFVWMVVMQTWRWRRGA